MTSPRSNATGLDVPQFGEWWLHVKYLLPTLLANPPVTPSS
jgi:hypothetical protein